MKENKFDVIVVGAGHAGIEASFVASNMGVKTALLTMNIDNMGKPSCNPSIGGTAKGHLVKEIDALGGAMGLLADQAGVLFKMLNKSKGPAIWSPRTQIDKDLYPVYAGNLLRGCSNLEIIQGTAIEILIESDNVKGVVTNFGETLYAKAVILCAGTFLNGKMFTGTNTYYGGRFGEPASEKISDLLAEYGFEKGRLKTGTPPRIHFDSIDFTKVVPEGGDERPLPFSHKSKLVENKLVCYGTETTLQTHNILRTGFDRSPMFTGRIEGVGPRYCPSIEDKIDRFAGRDSHKILLEPEGLSTKSVYVNGFSTSLPEDVQEKGLRSIAGLENMQILRYGYAIEYDFFFPYQLKYTLETKPVCGLYFAGQINGTSGYEEAASQGLVAGINAAAKILDKEELYLKRSEAYIGVLIDDLINKNTEEPYRIFTGLAEYRLMLRQDNADFRLMKYSNQYGLIPNSVFEASQEMKRVIELALEETKNIKLKPAEINDYLETLNETPLCESASLYLLTKRNTTSISELSKYFETMPDNLASVLANEHLLEKLLFEIKYDGYIQRQQREIDYFLENENKRIPSSFDYDKVNSLSKEALEKLKKIRPASLGQATRIAGVSASDVSIISLYLRS